MHAWPEAHAQTCQYILAPFTARPSCATCQLSSSTGRHCCAELAPILAGRALNLRVAVQDNEIKNGRLAMVAFLGFIAQHAATGKVSMPSWLCTVQAWTFLLHVLTFSEPAAQFSQDLKERQCAFPELYARCMHRQRRKPKTGFSGECDVQGPIDNLVDHINNPTGVTFATNGVSLPFVH